MTDRFNSLTVVLEKDMRDDDAESLLSAIMMLKGVIGVEGNVASSESYIAEVRARSGLKNKLYDLAGSI